MIETPPHPEYPSGHASDCFTGALVLQAAFPNLAGPVSYVAQPGRPPEGITMGMGQHSKLADSGIRAKRTYQTLAAMAEDCAESRIWAGAHFRAAVTEAKRVAQLISHRALAAVPSAPKAGRADRGLEQPKQRGKAITKQSPGGGPSRALPRPVTPILLLSSEGTRGSRHRLWLAGADPDRAPSLTGGADGNAVR